MTVYEDLTWDDLSRTVEGDLDNLDELDPQYAYWLIEALIEEA